MSLDCLVSKNLRHEIHNMKSTIDPGQKITLTQEFLGQTEFECVNVLDHENTKKSLLKKMTNAARWCYIGAIQRVPGQNI